jgi:uncharacterized membrane protein
MAMRPVFLAAVAAGCLSISPTVAQTVQSPGAGPKLTVPPAAAPPKDASLSHSALKATTFKIGSTVTNVTLLSYAAGGLVGGVALSTFMLAASWTIYTANDYLWDTYSPPPVKQDANDSFDAGSDVWRNTWKFVTYKPVVASLKLASLYVYTSSATIAVVFGTASVLTNTVVFYANNMAWDAYDWYSNPGIAAPTLKR